MFKNNQVKIEKLIPDAIQDLLKQHLNIEVDYTENLSESQKHAFNLFKENKNVIILGSAGCGKSYLIKIMEEYIKTNKKENEIYICSTTGISAYNIGGMTIHSFMGIGTGELEIDVLIRKVNRKKMYRDRIILTDILVIDEVSMLSAELFEKLNKICQVVRKSNQFFGGIQIILTGDLNQILPVFNKSKELLKGKDQDTRLIIESQEFIKEFNKENKNIINLTENFRQKNDPTFVNLLLRIRQGKHTEEDIKILKSRLIIKPIGSPVHIVISNKKAQVINESSLSNIKEPINKYSSIYKSSGKDKDINELLVKELKYQFVQKGIDTLELKKGTRVMLTKNLDVSIGLVNGSLGTIDSFKIELDKLYPIVIFDNEIKLLILPVPIELELDGCKATATQIPLMLAYALTSHRVQGLTLDSAVLDLADAFCDGQVFVALSRVRSLDGLYLKSFNPAKIKVNQKMTKFLESLN